MVTSIPVVTVWYADSADVYGDASVEVDWGVVIVTDNRSGHVLAVYKEWRRVYVRHG